MNDFETTLLTPYTNATGTLRFTEQLRVLLLDAVMEHPDPVKAIRHIYLRGHEGDLAPILRGIVPTPTAKEQVVKICYKRTLLQIDNILRGKYWLIDKSIEELILLGLPQLHQRLIIAYRNTNAPNTVVPLACLLLLLAKALENNELV